jgi:hypothetical protein
VEGYLDWLGIGTVASQSSHDIDGDFKIVEQNTSRGDLPNSRSFSAIFLRKNENNVIEDEVTMTCAVLPEELLRLNPRVADNENFTGIS